MSIGQPNKHEQAYRVLRERIVNGVYVPGYRLVIDALALELGVSAVPIREAIRRLEAEGWVVYRPNTGAQVASIDVAQYEADISTSFSMIVVPMSTLLISSVKPGSV